MADEDDDGPDEGSPFGKKKDVKFLTGTCQAIPNRSIDLKTAEKFRYEVGQFNGKKCHIAPYYNEAGALVAQQLRFPGKEFVILGDIGAAMPFWGQQLARSGGKMIVITEGQLDAISVTQAMGLSYPAVSLPNGAKTARKVFSKAIQWLESFEKVVLCFDMDEPGRAAVESVVDLLSPGKLHVATLPLKDANEMVKAGRSKELVDACWAARSYKPEAILEVSDLKAKALETTAWGLPWPWKVLTERTYGIRRGVVYSWGAGTGSGKTTLMKQLAMSAARPDLIEDQSDLFPMPAPRPIAMMLFEEDPTHTVRTVAGMVIKTRVHVPGAVYDREAHGAAIDSLSGLLIPMNLYTCRDWEAVKGHIKFLAASGVLDFIIDPMTALTATLEDERRGIDAIMADLAGLAEQLHITIHLVHHLATPDGKSHEEGGRVQEKHFRGSRAIAFWSHYMFGLERDKQDPDCPTTVRGLKDRLTGDAVGELMHLRYDRETGLMFPADPKQAKSPFNAVGGDDDCPF